MSADFTISTPVNVPDLVRSARAARADAQALGRRRARAVSVIVLATWLGGVAATGQLERVGANAAAAITMVFGSFVAGSTPQGGGAVAFPVFTKLLGVSAADARTFSLCIQAIGMGSAAIAVAVTRRGVDRGALRLTVPSAIAGFVAGTALFSLVTPPAEYVKVAFTLIVVAAGAATWQSRRGSVVEQRDAAPIDRPRVRAAVVVVATLGGVASALFGSGADVAVYVLVAIVLGVRPSAGVATSVVTMAAVSVVGLGFALATGGLRFTGAGADGGVDVAGMWLAAIPVVAVGAPLGSWCASRVSTATLARFIAALAVIELLSTIIFLDRLRTDWVLGLFTACGIAATLVGVHALMEVRDRLAASAPTSRTVRRLDLDVNLPPLVPTGATT